MRLLREILGYVLGGVVFVGVIPCVMWLVSGRPCVFPVEIWKMALGGLLAIVGLSWSIWAIVYMRKKGDGNPMDAFGHEVAPRTRHLMTSGPYRMSRNPMLSGIFVYLIGLEVWLWTWQAGVAFVLFVVVMMLQVMSEEKRLRRDFGKEYEDYCRKVGRFFPKWWVK